MAARRGSLKEEKTTVDGFKDSSVTAVVTSDEERGFVYYCPGVYQTSVATIGVPGQSAPKALSIIDRFPYRGVSVALPGDKDGLLVIVVLPGQRCQRQGIDTIQRTRENPFPRYAAVISPPQAVSVAESNHEEDTIELVVRRGRQVYNGLYPVINQAELVTGCNN